MIVHFYRNGVHMPSRTLDALPRIGETVQFLHGNPQTTRWRVVRINWIIGDNAEAHVFLKPVWSQL